MKDSKSSIIMILAVLAIASMFLTACTAPPSGEPRPGVIVSDTDVFTASFDSDEDISLLSFKSEAQFAEFIKQNSQGASYSGGFGGGVARTFAVGSAMEVAQASVAMDEGAMPKSAPDFSETNVQVVGVDEADIIKTDGDYIYTVSGKTLFIINAYPGETAEIAATIKFDDTPESLFVLGDYLAVFGNYRNADFFKEHDLRPSIGMTYFNIYDISEKDDPELVKEYKFEGNYFRARMVEEYVYFITTTRPEYGPVVPLPIIIDGAEVRRMPIADIYYYNLPYDDAQLANIHAINLEKPEEDINSKSVVVEGSQNMYMSQNNIYITYTEYINEWEIQQKIMIDLLMPRVSDADKAIIEKIRNADSDILSKNEKDNKIMNIIQQYVAYLDEDEQEAIQDEAERLLEEELDKYEYMEYTIVHKITVDGEDIVIGSSGKAPGHVINQFSMDESDYVLRIATTISSRWSRLSKDRTESMNNVFALDKNLEIIGELTGLAEGESIYSTRFMGDKLYMVTFKQVDPFFVIDLSNPEDIKELGQLKIPGFSRYLHPYDDNTIIGIGRDATEQGRTKGLKISLFDVSDVNNPEEVATFVAEGRHSSSTAEYEHKAFLFSKEKELLVIPAYSYDYQDGESDYNGAMVFKISKDEIELRGIVDHSKATSNRYGSAVERSLYIEELLYTKSQGLLRINNLEDLASVKAIELKYTDAPYTVY